MPALLATRIERLKPRHGAPARPLGLLASIEAARLGAPRHRRAVTPSAEFDERRRWLIVAAAGLFGLSVLMLGLLQAGGGITDARPGNAVVVAASPLPSPQLPAPAPAAEQPAVTQPQVNVTSHRPAVSTNQGFRSAGRLIGPWFPFFPMSG